MDSLVVLNFSLAKPKGTDIRDLRDWLESYQYGNQFLDLAEKDLWSPKWDDDRVGLSLKPGEGDDALGTAVSKKVIAILNFIYGRAWKRKHSDEMFQWSESWLLLTISFVFTTLAACFPVLAILALYKSQANGVEKGWQIGMIGFFAGTCAAVLALARAKRTDIFLATSA